MNDDETHSVFPTSDPTSPRSAHLPCGESARACLNYPLLRCDSDYPKRLSAGSSKYVLSAMVCTSLMTAGLTWLFMTGLQHACEIPCLAAVSDIGATSILVKGSSMVGRSVVINPGGPTEEHVVIGSRNSHANNSFSLAEALKHRHEVGEPVYILRFPPKVASSTQASLEPQICSAAAYGAQAPPVSMVTDLGAAHLFDDLSPQEVKAVAEVVVAATGCVDGPLSAEPGQNFISGNAGIELLPPPKQQALAFMDKGGPRPPRYARVTCARPVHNDVMEYRVGPISGSSSSPVVATGIEPLLRPGQVPYNKRPPDLTDVSLSPLVNKVLGQLRPLLEETFGHAFSNFDSFDPKHGMIIGWPIFPHLSSTSTARVTMVKFFWFSSKAEVNAGMWLHPVPLVFGLNQSGLDPSGWSTMGLYFCGEGPFKLPSELLAAYHTRRKTPCPWKMPDPKKNNNPGDWDVAGRLGGTPNPRTSKRGPRLVNPDGPRWRLSARAGGNGRQVEWMGWSFFTSVRPGQGLAIWDIRFKGQRVGYELSWQESAAVYGGGQGDQTYYLDAAMTGLGAWSPNLRLGLDCPEGASLFNSTRTVSVDQKTFDFDGKWTQPSSVESACIFEADTSETLWSHAEMTTGSATTRGVRASNLVVRSMANSGNYDYYGNVLFGLDGSIQWKSRLAGYAETRWFNPAHNGWEQSFSPIAHGIALPVHSHLLSVKVDMDVGAHDSNALEKMESVVGWPHTARAANVLQDIPTKFLKSSYVVKEGQGLSTMIPNASKPMVWRIVNRNLEGPSPYSAPGFAIVPGEATINTLPDSHPLSKFIAYSKYTIAFTRRHDYEQRSSSYYDCYMPSEPHTSLDRFLADGESLNNTDIVAWVTVAHEHMPRTEDIPLITNYETGFKMIPWNLFDGNAAMDLPGDDPNNCLARAL